jgi:hypothetical protein
MKKILSKVIGSSIIASLLIVPMLSVKAEVETEQEDRAANAPLQIQERERENIKDRVEQIREQEKDRLEQIRETEKNRLEDRFSRIERPLLRASTTERRLENRENNIERIRDRIASTTLASTTASTTKRLEKLDDRLIKQEEQMGKVRERLQERETKVMDILGQIASKIQARITLLAGQGLNMTAATAKLAEASAKIEEMTVEGDKLATLINTNITASSSAQLFIDIRASQNKIRTMAGETHALLVDTIKEITKVLPAKPIKTGTSTASSTE